ncbi:MAG: hypothetical protein KDC12_03300 [Flavobacteriales bacterium]|nr:hypothetical protein [Flavobacteriales bacterium]
MVDLHLLTKIAGNDAEFRKSIVQRVGTKARSFVADFAQSFRKANYNSCYYKTLSFYQSIMPYCKISFLNDMQKSLNILSHTHDPELKQAICRAILKDVASAMVQSNMVRRDELNTENGVIV